ncbi:general substrate transporter [Parathielavia hyrcaniae]|uniref:General substrate transporter n=1 Tax=Parathielavia hyrcaniae TaxID=113614 RepID=A0AAN6PPT5_9PEZI|nr:general substrate transporter [Parathielavia hyrcaniae]
MGKAFNISLAAFAATGSFLFGYDSGVMTDVIASENFLEFFHTDKGSAIIGAINSTFSGGAVFGSLMGGLTMDRFGRRKTIMIGALIALVGAILQAAAQNLAMILVGRIIAGWAVGLLSMAVPVYQSECAHPKIRGLIVGLAQQMIGVGFIVSTWVGYGSAHAYGSLGQCQTVAGIYNCVGPLANLVFITLLIDRVGRRRPLLWGTTAIAIALICESAINSRIDKANPDHGLSIGGVFFLFCVTVIFSWSWGPISWVYMSEVMPMQIRARGNAFATGIGNWLVSTFWAQVSPIALKELDWKFYFLFVAWDIVVTIPVVFFFFKETKQMSLEEIDLLFGERSLGALPKDLDKGSFAQDERHGAEETRA